MVADLSKEMLDLAMKIKKHLRTHHQINIALADPNLMDKLLEMHNLEDPTLQGMLGYLMSLAGPEWAKQYQKSIQKKDETGSAVKVKSKFGVYRGSAQPVEKEEKPTLQEEKKIVRYYRGQPVYEND